MNYTTIQFLDDLKKEAQIVSGNMISNKNMSELLTGQADRHYEIKKTLVKNYAAKGKTYLISLEILKDYKKNLKSIYRNKYNYSNFEKIFSSYSQANTLKEYTNSTLNHNPNLSLNYFKIIDSKEKAYWLGWIFAEGHINKHGGLQIEIGLKDEILVIRFANTIGFERNNIIYKKRINDKGTETRTILITFQDSCFTGHLLDKGLIVGKKSRLIKLPDFGDIHTNQVRKLYLAFLLGYFDGDGQQSSSRIYSNSYKLLSQIKNKFNIESKISRQKYLTKKGYERNKYMMFLTAELFNEMLNNYQFSLIRKRIKLTDSFSRKEQLKKARELHRIKFMFSKEELQNLLFEMPQTQITKLHHKKFDIKIGRTTIYRYVKKWGLKTPTPNYWRINKYE